MSDEARVRKDGRPLVTEHPVTAEDYIGYLGTVGVPNDATRCRGSRDDAVEAWMLDD